MTEIKPSDTFLRNSNILTTGIGDETVMLDTETQNNFRLDATGTAIWNMLQTPKTLAELIAELMQQFKVDQSACEADLKSFLSKMLELKVISTTGTNKP